MDRNQLTILIADDTATDRMILKTIIEHEGHQVVIAKDGQEAVDSYRLHKPDIVLMDVIMPVINGMEAASIIKSELSNNFVPILFLTSLHDPDSLAACLNAGGDDFLSKPYNPLILKAKIGAALRTREMHRQLQLHNQNMKMEQLIAKSIFDKVAHYGQLDRPNIKYRLSPMSVFNGDTLLVATRPDGGLNCFIGDFTGHGLSAAIGTMPLAEVFYGMTARGYPITDIIREINEKLFRYLPVNFFCAAAMIEIHEQIGQINIWLGGLPDIVIYYQDNRTCQVLESDNLPLGIVSGESFKQKISTHDLAPGDQVFLWSDGLHEAVGDKGEMFGADRVMSVFNENTQPEMLFDQLVSRLDDFKAGGKDTDDLTLLSVTMEQREETGLASQLNNPDLSKNSRDWVLTYQLQPNSIRNYDPTSFLVKSLMEVEGLTSINSLLYTVIAELYSNAVDHGLLQLSSKLKNSSEGFAQYYQQREASLKSLTNGTVTFRFRHKMVRTGGVLTIYCLDTGSGFDHEAKLKQAIIPGQFSGKGLPLLLRITDSIQFKRKGRLAIAQISWSDNLSAQF